MYQNLNTFELVVSGLIHNPEWFDELKGNIAPADWPTYKLRRLMEIIEGLIEDGADITSEILCALYGEEEEEDYIEQLVDSGEEITRNTWSSLLKKSSEKIVRKHLVSEITDLITTAEGGADASSLLNLLSGLHESAGQKLIGGESTSIVYGDAVKIALTKMRERAETDNFGLSTGLRDLDAQITGLCGGDLVIVGARPSMGKTAFSMNLIESASRQGSKSMVFSIEMASEDLALRSIASVGSIDYQHLRKGVLSEFESARLEEAVSTLRDFNIVVDDRANLTVSMVEAAAMKEHAKGKLGLIMIDYLQLMSLSDIDEETASRRIGEVSRRLKLLAKKLDVPIVVLSQLNRSLEQRPNKRPIKSDLRDSGAVEQDADIIMFLYRDEVYNEHTKEKGIAEIIIDKQRNGPIGTVKAEFIGKYSRFGNLPKND